MASLLPSIYQIDGISFVLWSIIKDGSIQIMHLYLYSLSWYGSVTTTFNQECAIVAKDDSVLLQLLKAVVGKTDFQYLCVFGFMLLNTNVAVGTFR